MGDITIRDFRFDDDYESVHDLWTQCGPGIQLGRSDTPEEIRRKVEQAPDLFLVAEHKGVIAGTVIGGFDGRRGMIYHLAVREDLRKHGLGNLLMDEVEKRLKSKGCVKCYLLVKSQNTGAQKFYENRGWSHVSNALLYGKEL